MPYPADYGGVIDVFFKIKSLFELGIEITLHCFEYGRVESKELEKYCKKVYYYKREMGFLKLLRRTPFIVNTRNSKKLISNLCLDNETILFEGLHSCYFMNNKALSNRKKIVRTHNIEHDYYSNLSKAETSFFQKIYFLLESRKLKRFEKVLEHASYIAAISKNDEIHFKKINPNTIIISAFHQNTTIEIQSGIGSFVLYHGNLGVAENYNAAVYLCNKVFTNSNIPFYIAGNNAPQLLIDCVKKFSHIKLIENIGTNDIIELIKKAQINILITQQATGIKLKLLAALFNGRFCVVNNEMIVNTGLENYCIVGNNEIELQELVQQYFEIPFSQTELNKRKSLENGMFSNEQNANKLFELI